MLEKISIVLSVINQSNYKIYSHRYCVNAFCVYQVSQNDSPDDTLKKYKTMIHFSLVIYLST